MTNSHSIGNAEVPTQRKVNIVKGHGKDETITIRTKARGEI